ncbi:MAG: triose-phosphate isomerase [Enterobacterales bacterium endosymbiont of Blomia tropicalis]|uniref:triose-phosphate isomerase family protein n=1 Tax=Mixta mediterraneensis TaxID=2758443 RepID=UPI0025A8D023|nr:triose-phosphate isomerase family protein [Mixta mediterraneensis]MDL4912874.1 triose-phosphate isomerase [Mixta mediterraneensis]
MSQPAIWLGVSLKMYFGYQQTLTWCRDVSELARRHPAIVSGEIGLFVLPAYPAIPAVAEIFADTPVRFGGQDVCQAENGAWTGEVSASMLQELGCSLAEIGHAERRRHFHEDKTQIAAKVAMSLRHGLTPVLCIGEEQEGEHAQAIALCQQQLAEALASAEQQGLRGSVFFAYEPQWAIGAPQPAPDSYIRAVCAGLGDLPTPAGIDLQVIYGGSAGPGLIQRLAGDVDGLFLGRFAHDPDALAQIVDEASALLRETP